MDIAIFSQICDYYNHFWNELVVFFYPDDTVNFGCKQQVEVDNMMKQYQVVVDNTMNRFVHDISNYYLVLFH